jgi:hypothetical protein
VVASRNVFENAEQLIKRGSFAAREVDDASHTQACLGGAHVGGDHVRDVGKVTRLLAIAVDNGLLVTEEHADEA